MSVSNGFKFIIIIFILISHTYGCMSWEEGWKNVETPSMEGDIKLLFKMADKQISEADNNEKLLTLIKTYETILKIDPDNYKALWSLGRYYLLIGAAYSQSKDEKEKYYLKGIKYCERAMYQNNKFIALVDKGTKAWDACEVLKKNEIEAMYYWYALVGSYWKECFSWAGKLINIQWPRRAGKILPKMIELDPLWAGGHPYFAKAIFYASVPGIFGGDLKKSEEYFKKAVEAGPNWLYIRWGRAKLLHVKKKDKISFKKDLQWVISRDPRMVDSPYPWNVYFQREAREMLKNIDNYF